jgi:DNA-binding PadR family transcriptional regulator
MGDRTFLGEFEHMVLAAALRVDEPYGAALVREIEDRTGRRVQAGSLYITLERLQAKGLVTLREGEATPGRGGRPRKLAEVTEEGMRALAEHRVALLSMWDGLEARLGKG